MVVLILWSLILKNGMYGEKTVFGQIIHRPGEEHLEYDDVIDALFAQRSNEIAGFICTEIYKFFVGYCVVDSIIEEMKTTFLNNNFNIRLVVEQLLLSEHFFDEHNIGTKIKSPIDALLSLAKDLNLDMDTPVNVGLELKTITSEVGYWFSVTGREIKWKHVLLCGASGWLNAGSLTTFWDIFDHYMNAILNDSPDLLRQFAVNVSNNATDPYVITQTIIDYLILGGMMNDNPDSDVYQYMTDIFISGFENYVNAPSWNLQHFAVPQQVANLLKTIVRQPIFQLF